MLLLGIGVRNASGGTRLRLAAATIFTLGLCPGSASGQAQRADMPPFRHVFCNGSAIAGHGDTVRSYHSVGVHALDTKWLIIGDSAVMLAVWDSTGRQGIPFRPASPKAQARTLRGFQSVALEYERHDAFIRLRSRSLVPRCDPDTLATMR